VKFFIKGDQDIKYLD